MAADVAGAASSRRESTLAFCFLYSMPNSVLRYFLRLLPHLFDPLDLEHHHRHQVAKPVDVDDRHKFFRRTNHGIQINLC